MRKRLAVLLTVVLGATFIVATATGASASVADKKETKCNAKKSVKGIQKAFDQFLTGETGEDKMKFVDITKAQLAEIAAAIDESSAAAAAAGNTQEGRETLSTGYVVTCQGKTKANFSYDLYFKDTTTNTTTPPLGLSFIGDAALKKGVWKISGATVCDLTAQNPDAAEAGAKCFEAIGLEVPTG